MRGDNVHRIGDIRHDEAAVEMAALEALGPSTRKVIRNAAIKVSAASILEQLQDFDPHDPAIDQAIANMVDTFCRNLLRIAEFKS